MLVVRGVEIGLPSLGGFEVQSSYRPKLFSPLPSARSSILMLRFLFVFFAWLSCWQLAAAVDHVVLQREGKEVRVSGKLLVTAGDGGLLLLADDGVLWTVEPAELVQHTSDDQPFRPLTAEQLGQKLLAELPAGFEVYTTANYVICYNTSRAYAQWCGSLFERLNRAKINYWSRKGLKLHQSELPLVALVFGDANSYRQYAKDELGEAVDSIIGYYSLRTNRITMYDLTGVEALRQPESRRSTAAQINEMLSQPSAAPMVATVIHEATHQIAFNCGLQTRYSDNPLWVSEGLAVYFETPDLQSSRGWRGIGDVNRPRLAAFLRSLPDRPSGSLASLIVNDERMRNVRTAADAYAEAWALNYYLLRHKPQQYVAYLRLLSEKPQLVWDSPETRLEEFCRFFGNDLDTLEADFVRQIQKVR